MKTVANNVLSSLFSSLLVLFLVAGAFFFLYTLRAEGSRYDFVKSLKYEILFKKTLARSLATLPVIVIFVYIFSFTVLFTLGAFQKAAFDYRDVAVPSYVFLLVLLMIVIASNFLFVPNLRKNIALLEHRSRIADDGYRHAKELVQKREYGAALALFDILFEIDKKNRNMNELHKNIEKALLESGTPAGGRSLEESERGKGAAGGRRASTGASRRKSPAARPPESTRTGGPAEPGGYYEKALAEYERGDIHSALFYLERAVSLHKDNREMRALYDRVRREAERSLGALTKQEKERQRLVKEKAKGIEYLEAGKHYEAYEIFLPLSRRYPTLTDLRLYLREAEEDILKNDFFPEEAKRFEWFPSTNNVVFLDREGYFITVEKVVSYMSSYYFYNVTRHRRSRDAFAGERFKYGKWIENRIVLKNDEGFVKRSAVEAKRRTIVPFVSPGYLQYAGNVSNLKGQLNVFEYLQKSAGLRASGLDVEERFEYLAKSCGQIFAVYVLALVMAALAWSRRSIHDFPPLGRLFLFFVSVPPLCYFLYHLYTGMNGIIMYTHQYAVRSFLPRTNILLYTLIVHLVLSACATLYYLSQSSKME
jgi:tetratricopeptide (TPR) repeat protein